MDEYNITVVDPYDWSGNGPRSYEHLRKRFPKLTFVQDVLNSNTSIEGVYDAVISTSVVEHIPPSEVYNALLGIDKVLKPGGYSIHVIDFTVTGEGRIKQIVDEILCKIFTFHGFSLTPQNFRETVSDDHAAHYLSPLCFNNGEQAEVMLNIHGDKLQVVILCCKSRYKNNGLYYFEIGNKH